MIEFIAQVKRSGLISVVALRTRNMDEAATSRMGVGCTGAVEIKASGVGPA